MFAHLRFFIWHLLSSIAPFCACGAFVSHLFFIIFPFILWPPFPIFSLFSLSRSWTFVRDCATYGFLAMMIYWAFPFFFKIFYLNSVDWDSQNFSWEERVHSHFAETKAKNNFSYSFNSILRTLHTFCAFFYKTTFHTFTPTKVIIIPKHNIRTYSTNNLPINVLPSLTPSPSIAPGAPLQRTASSSLVRPPILRFEDDSARLLLRRARIERLPEDGCA